jgi:hypothetical protein
VTYFNLRKHQPEDEPDEAVAEEPSEEEAAEGAAAPVGLAGALWTGISGPGRWLTGRGWPGAAWALYAGSAWAIGFYGGWIAAGIVLGWLALVAMFVPREHLDRLAEAVERLDSEDLTATVGEGPAAAPMDPRHALARWLLDTIGERPGIHLRELYPAMRNLPGQEGRTDAELRALLKGFGVRVSRSVRIGRTAGRSGVYRRHVEALLPSDGESRVETGGDAGQTVDSPPLSAHGEGL